MHLVARFTELRYLYGVRCNPVVGVFVTGQMRAEVLVFEEAGAPWMEAGVVALPLEFDGGKGPSFGQGGELVFVDISQNAAQVCL